ncbi:hemerythrin [Mycolicibacterium celeriflavum]|uniref:hemerythrin domain-containing protein n=1 Tax=Mycolicibacterium celeriflavum TaxID=1249101 RepID=UPI0007FC763A|nr:hemerythrin domain-containing protein [Mycolicibacterium celeriflavum]OBG15713.1 hemerythrin [Mycolicibacterium celeriflavum]
MDALTFLRDDHKSVLGMLEVLDGAPSGTGAEVSGLRTMVTNLIIAESQHEAIEQQFFWPAVRDVIGDGLADEAIAQEQAGKKLLQTLEDKEPGDPEDREKIGEQLEAAKKVAPTRPHPDTPPSSLVQKTMGLGAATVDHVRDAVSGRDADNPPDPQQH